MTTTRETRNAKREMQEAEAKSRFATWTLPLATYLLLLTICALAFALRAQKITWVGTHRDEGVYISLADQMFHGKVIYRDAVDNKPPGLPWFILGLFHLFGPGIIVPRVAAVLTASLTCLLAFLIGRETSGSGVGLLAALFVAVDPLSIFWGRFALTEPLMALLDALALYVFIVAWRRSSRWPFGLSGFLIGCAFTVKQPGLIVAGALVIFVGIEVLWHRQTIGNGLRAMVAIGMGGLLAYLPVILYFWANAALPDYLAFVFEINKFQLRSLLDAPARLAATWEYALRRPAMLMALPAVAVILLRKDRRPFEPLLILWATIEYAFLFSLQHLEYEWGGFSHYILSALVPLSLLSAIFATWVIQQLATAARGVRRPVSAVLKPGPLLASLALVAVLMVTFQPFWADLRKALAVDYPGSTLAQEAGIGARVREMTAPGDRILVFANAIFYYWAGREPASRFIHYTWRYGQTQFGGQIVADINAVLRSPDAKVTVVSNDTLQWLLNPSIKTVLKNEWVIRDIVPYDYNFHDQVCFFTPRVSGDAPLPVFDSADRLAIQHPLAATFDDEVKLLGVDVDSFTLQPGQPLRVNSYWQVLARTRQDYTIVARLVDDAGTKIGVDGGFPLQDRYPTGLWTAGEVFRDDRAIPISPDLPAGRYRLELELYDLKLGRSAPATGSTALPPFKVTQSIVPPSAVTHPLGAEFAHGLRLAGFNLEPTTVQPGQTVMVTSYWQAGERLAEDYTVFVHLTDNQGRVIAQSDGEPDGGRYPTSIWEEGELVKDARHLAIPADTPPGEYRLKTGMYLLATLERVTVVDDASGENAVELGTITVVD